MMPGHESWMLGGWLVFPIFWLVPFLLLYFALTDRFKGRRPSARELLDQAYARGELSRDEYLKKRNDIEGH
jgi:putative membrane protein